MTIWEWDQTDMQVWHEAHTAMTYYRQGVEARRNAEAERAKQKAG